MVSSRCSEDTSIHSGVESLSDYSHKPPMARRTLNTRGRPTLDARRQSRILYAEKYGLNSPTDTTQLQSDNGQEQDEDDDDRPLSYQRSYSSPTVRPTRPRSLFNLLQTNQTNKRPAAFVKPTTATSTIPHTVPSDMLSIQQLYEQYQKKVYLEGFVFKRNKCNSDGSPSQDDQWTRLYVELAGPILSLWDERKLSKSTSSVLPYYINVTDATVTMENDKEDALVVLNTAGRNQYLIRPDRPTTVAQQWNLAIRLSCFECARLFEIYTRYLLLRPIYHDLSSKRKRRMEGFVQARFAGDTEWKKYWAVASDQKDEKRLFGKAKSIPCRGQFMFYETKKSKWPTVTLVNIVQAYTLYPQSPQLIDKATMFKVEGTTLTTTDLKTGEQNKTHDSAGTLLMASDTNELVQWLFSVFDVFKLYGLPTRLLDDPMDPQSLNFGETANIIGYINDSDDDADLFLKCSDVMHLPIRKDETLLDSKTAFTKALAEKLKNGSSSSTTATVTNTATAASTPPQLGTMKPRANSAPLLANIAPPSDYTMQHTKTMTTSETTATTSPILTTLTTGKLRQSTSTLSMPLQSQQQEQQKRFSMLNLSRSLVYASDESEDDHEESDDAQSDNESVLINTAMTPELPVLKDQQKEIQLPSEPSTPSPATSLHSSTTLATTTRIVPLNDEYQEEKDNNDIMGFAKSLLSRTFGTDLTTSPSSNTHITNGNMSTATVIATNTNTNTNTNTSSATPINSDNHTRNNYEHHDNNHSPTLRASSPTQAFTASPKGLSPTLATQSLPKASKTVSSTTEKPPISKRMSVLPLPSDDEDSDADHNNAMGGEDDDDDEDEDDDDNVPVQNQRPGQMKISTSASSYSSSSRPFSTAMSPSATTTPTTTVSNRSSAATNSDVSSNTSTSSQGKLKRQSILSSSKGTTSPQTSQKRSSSFGLVHKIDSMQQQIQYQQQQKQQLQEQQPLWETGSLMGTDPRIAAYQYRPQQQQQAWETGSMTGSIAGGGIGPDPRIAMYRRATGISRSSSQVGAGGGNGSVHGASINNNHAGGGGSIYGGSCNGSVYGATNGSVYNGSIYGGADDYQKTMMMTGQPLIQMEQKPSEPRAGLIGMISQLEDEKREKENNNRFSTNLSSQQIQQQQLQEQLIYQQQLLQQQQMMMSNPYMLSQMNPMMMNQMNPMMLNQMNPMMMNTMNPMVMNPMMMNPMMMRQQPWPTNGNQYYNVYNTNQTLMEEENEDDDDVPLARPSIPSDGNAMKSRQRQSTRRF